MEKLLYDQSQRPYLIVGVQMQIDVLKKQLADLYALLGQLDSSLVDENILPMVSALTVEKAKVVKRPYSQREGRDSDKDYFTKVKQVLELEGNKPLTTREILTRIYEYYPDEFDEDEDRKNIASLSAILTEKHTEGKIIRNKPEIGHAVFSLPKTIAFDPVIEEPIKYEKDNSIADLDYELDQFEKEKVELDDDDLPF